MASDDLVDIACRPCQRFTSVKSDATSVRCSGCSKINYFRECSGCGHVNEWPIKQPLTCLYCQTTTGSHLRMTRGRGGESTAGEYVRSRARRGLDPAKALTQNLLVQSLVVGGYGSVLAAGTRVILVLDDGPELRVQAPAGVALASFHVDEILGLHIGGPGVRASGGGFIGGGFGLLGTLQGAALANALNRLTTKITITSIITVTTKDAEVVIANPILEPDRVNVLFSPLLGRLRSREAASPAREEPQADVAAQLQQLGRLHADGVLNDDEFSRAKAKLLQ